MHGFAIFFQRGSGSSPFPPGYGPAFKENFKYTGTVSAICIFKEI